MTRLRWVLSRSSTWAYCARALLLVALAMTVELGTADAQTSGNLDLHWNTVDGGGTTAATSGALQLGSTSGQPDTGRALSGTLTLTGGFWAGVAKGQGLQNTATPTPTNTPTCAPTGTPYCSNLCPPAPTIAPGCFVSGGGPCIQNPRCSPNEVCVPSPSGPPAGCCACAAMTPTYTPTRTVTHIPTAIPTNMPTRMPTATPSATGSPPSTAMPSRTLTATVSHTSTGSARPTPTATTTPPSTHTATRPIVPTPTPTPSRTPIKMSEVCFGDCNMDGAVTVNDMITMVNVALGSAVAQCPAGDGNSDGHITVNEIITAVNRVLNGCGRTA